LPFPREQFHCGAHSCLRPDVLIQPQLSLGATRAWLVASLLPRPTAAKPRPPPAARPGILGAGDEGPMNIRPAGGEGPFMPPPGWATRPRAPSADSRAGAGGVFAADD